MNDRNYRTRPRDKQLNLQNIEDEINVFVAGIYWEDSRQYKKWRQRSIIITLQAKKTLQEDIDSLAESIQRLEDTERPLFTEVMDQRDFIETHRSQRPQDSAIVSIVSPLIVVKRSPKTGEIFWNDRYAYCPQTSAQLEYVIAAGSKQDAIASADDVISENVVS